MMDKIEERLKALEIKYELLLEMYRDLVVCTAKDHLLRHEASKKFIELGELLKVVE
jgi:hypothetical protein